MLNRLKEIRSAFGLTQTEFAQRVHLTPQSISMIESGKRPLTDRLIYNICAEFGIDEHWLRTGDGDMYPTPADEDAELMELMAMLTADDMDPHKKRIVSNMCRYIMSLSADDLDRLNDLISALSAALDNKKDED